MSVPGLNLLSIAGGVIALQAVQWERFVSREIDARGVWVNRYADPVTIRGSWQPVDARTIKELGFDVSKVYRNFYTSHPIDNVRRDAAPDLIHHAGWVYEVVSVTDWYGQDGWRTVMCVGADPR